mmetsp:Transcript_32796/g.85833  ORF Transcript_32796/g.85833 Transcript_32796/m.85833 type:complete len:240 (+) Transcript_32796:2301-3020(+)
MSVCSLNTGSYANTALFHCFSGRASGGIHRKGRRTLPLSFHPSVYLSPTLSYRFANPKSATLRMPPFATKTFRVARSMCTILMDVRYARASAIWRPYEMSSVPRRVTSLSLHAVRTFFRSPYMQYSSTTRYGSCFMHTPRHLTMFSWLNSRCTTASAVNVAAQCSGSFGFSVLTARGSSTSIASPPSSRVPTTWFARYTSPNSPLPTCSTAVSILRSISAFWIRSTSPGARFFSTTSCP